MDKSAIIAALAMGTLLVGMAIAAYQVWSVKDAKAAGSRVDGSRGSPEAGRPETGRSGYWERHKSTAAKHKTPPVAPVKDQSAEDKAVHAGEAERLEKNDAAPPADVTLPQVQSEESSI